MRRPIEQVVNAKARAKLPRSGERKDGLINGEEQTGRADIKAGAAPTEAARLRR